MSDLDIRRILAGFAQDPDAFNDMWRRGYSPAAACSLLPKLAMSGFPDDDFSALMEDIAFTLQCVDANAPKRVCRRIADAVRTLNGGAG